MYMHRKSPDLFLVAMLDEQVVGYAVGELRKSLYGSPVELLEIGHILNIALENGKKRKGVGTKLILELELRFRQRKATVAMLEVRESNTSARSFYTVLGYRETIRLAMYYGDEDAIVMTKDLFLIN